jgi:hypothetical protein
MGIHPFNGILPPTSALTSSQSTWDEPTQVFVLTEPRPPVSLPKNLAQTTSNHSDHNGDATFHRNLQAAKKKRRKQGKLNSHASGGKGSNQLVDDIEASRNVVHYLPTSKYIMFWRPQKVGSSTILSILISFGFRYNVLPRPKMFKNSFCVKIAKCASEDLRYSNYSEVIY